MRDLDAVAGVMDGGAGADGEVDGDAARWGAALLGTAVCSLMPGITDISHH